MNKEQLIEEIKKVKNDIRQKFILMQFGKLPLDYEELLFQFEEGINRVLKDSDVDEGVL